MTEEQIEVRAERSIDSLDRALMRGDLTQAEYDRLVKVLDRAVEQAMSRREK